MRPPLRKNSPSPEPALAWSCLLLLRCVERSLSPGRFHASFEGGDNLIHIKHTARPGASAGALQGGPEAGVIWEFGVRSQIGPRGARSKHLDALCGGKFSGAFPDQIYAGFDSVPINHDTNDIAIEQLANRPTRERFRPDMADAGAR